MCTYVTLPCSLPPSLCPLFPPLLSLFAHLSSLPSTPPLPLSLPTSLTPCFSPPSPSLVPSPPPLPLSLPASLPHLPSLPSLPPSFPPSLPPLLPSLSHSLLLSPLFPPSLIPSLVASPPPLPLSLPASLPHLPSLPSRRSGYFSYLEDKKPYGITLYRFALPRDELVSANQDPGFYANGPDGLLNLTAVFEENAPVFASKPHFLDADPSYRNNVTGLEPDRSLHDSYLDVEPITGQFVSRAHTYTYYIHEQCTCVLTGYMYIYTVELLNNIHIRMDHFREVVLFSRQNHSHYICMYTILIPPYFSKPCGLCMVVMLCMFCVFFLCSESFLSLSICSCGALLFMYMYDSEKCPLYRGSPFSECLLLEVFFFRVSLG